MNDLMIPLVTVPVLALVLTVRTTSRLLNEVGQLSEELFRGHRLPNVEFDIPDPEGPLTPNSGGT